MTRKKQYKSKGYTEGDVAVVGEPFPIEEEIIPIKVEPIKHPEYRIIVNPKTSDLEAYVREYLNLGWSCLGGATFSDKLGEWSQTMIKEYSL